MLSSLLEEDSTLVQHISSFTGIVILIARRCFKLNQIPELELRPWLVIFRAVGKLFLWILTGLTCILAIVHEAQPHNRASSSSPPEGLPICVLVLGRMTHVCQAVSANGEANLA